MVFIIHRYIFRELIKVFLLATVTLTLIVSLGSLLRQIQDYGVGPVQVIRLLGYFLPITLTFVLPVGALFASTLIYGRFTSDNELNACRASGISMWTLVYPGLFLALLVAIANLVLSFHVVPEFAYRARKTVMADAKQILFRNIERKGYYNMPDSDYQIYAENVDSATNNLISVVVIKTNDQGQIDEIITAERAEIEFVQHKMSNEVNITAYSTFFFSGEERIFFSRFSRTVEFPSLMTDKIAFQKLRNMHIIRSTPTAFNPIAKLAYQAYAQLSAELLAEDIASVIVGDVNAAYEFFNGEKVIRLSADNCSANRHSAVELLGNVKLSEHDGNTDVLLKEYNAAKAAIQFARPNDPRSKLILTMPSARWTDANELEVVDFRHSVKNITMPAKVGAKLGEDTIETVRDHAYLSNQSPILADQTKRLLDEIAITYRKIDAEMHSRLVFGIGCITIVMVGIGLGIKFKSSHMLAAFGASTIPAAGLIVFIMMGKNIMKNPDSMATSGIMFMWAGFAILAVMCILLYRKLLKN